jgi:hypothetical protein
VAGASSYNIYGRGFKEDKLINSSNTNSFTDSGTYFEDDEKRPLESPTALTTYSFKLPADFIYLSIPTLEEFYNEETLEEGTHYEVVNSRELLFDADVPTTLNLDSNLKTSSFLGESFICLSPRIQHFYLPIFGVKDLPEFLREECYEPPIEGYGALSLKDKALAKAKHLKFFTWAYSTTLRKGPSMADLLKGWSLAKGYPFSYEKGTVTNKTSTTITIEGEETIEYKLLGNSSDLIVGDEVNAFDILITGAQVKDYISHEADITLLASEEEEPRLIIQLISTASNLTPSPEVVQAFKISAIPAGLTVKE